MPTQGLALVDPTIIKAIIKQQVSDALDAYGAKRNDTLKTKRRKKRKKLLTTKLKSIHLQRIHENRPRFFCGD